MHACIIVCMKHGIGDELTVIGSLVASLLNDNWTVEITTFHQQLYSHPNLAVRSWQEIPFGEHHAATCDLGICMVSRPGARLPLEFDRTSMVQPACKARGYVILDGDGRDAGLDFDNGYDYAKHVLRTLGLKDVPPPWSFLERTRTDTISLVPLGNGDLIKGMAPELAWSVVDKVATMLPHASFVMPMTDAMPHPPAQKVFPENVAIVRLPYGAPELLRLHLDAAKLVTAEGGGYHIARAAAIPALLVTSRYWMDQVKHAVTPEPRDALLFDHVNPDAHAIASRIALWIDDRSA